MNRLFEGIRFATCNKKKSMLCNAQSKRVLHSLLFIGVFSLHSFGYTRLRKIINSKKIVRFTMRKSLLHNFWERSSKILFLRNSWFTQHFQECNPAYSREGTCIFDR